MAYKHECIIENAQEAVILVPEGEQSLFDWARAAGLAPAAPPASDVRVENHGSVFTMTPLTDAAKAWFDEHISSEGWQWLGGSLAVDPRLVGNVINGLQGDGLTVDGGGL